MRMAHLGVRELATASRVDKGTISAWKTGRQTRVQVDKVRRVATPLGTTAEHLLDMPPEVSRGATGKAGARQSALLHRFAALQPMLETLDGLAASGLSRALSENGAKLERLDELLPELKRLADEAREVG